MCRRYILEKISLVRCRRNVGASPLAPEQEHRHLGAAHRHIGAVIASAASGRDAQTENRLDEVMERVRSGNIEKVREEGDRSGMVRLRSRRAHMSMDGYER